MLVVQLQSESYRTEQRSTLSCQTIGLDVTGCSGSTTLWRAALCSLLTGLSLLAGAAKQIAPTLAVMSSLSLRASICPATQLHDIKPALSSVLRQRLWLISGGGFQASQASLQGPHDQMKMTVSSQFLRCGTGRKQSGLAVHLMTGQSSCSIREGPHGFAHIVQRSTAAVI